MKIYDVPDYTGEKGKIGERLYNWLLRIPIIGTIIMRYFAHDQWLEHVSDTWAYNSLLFWSEHGDNKLREACLEGMRRRFPHGVVQQENLAQFMSRLRENPSQVLGDTLTDFFDHPVVKELAEVVGATVFDSVMTMAIGGKEKLSPDLQDRIRRFLGTTVLLSVAPRIGGTVAEVTTLGQVETLGQVFKDAYFNLGLGFVTWQMTSPLIDGGIGRELKNQAQHIYRPERFSWAQLRDLYALGRIGIEDVREQLRRLGWRDQDIEHMLMLAFRTVSESKIIGMWTDQMITDEDALARLRATGYSYNDAALILDYARETKADAQKDILLSTARNAFVEGLIAEDRFRNILAGLNFSAEAIDLEVGVQSLKMQEEARNLNTSQLKAAFLTNVITEVEAMAGLQELHFRNDEAAKLIETWKRSRPLKVLRVNKQTILLAWQRGVLTETEARNKLREIGYPVEDINLIIASAKAEGATTKAQASIGLLLEGVRSNVISIAALQSELRARGYDGFDIKLITQIAQERKVIPLTTDAVLDAFEAKVLTRSVAQQKLLDLGMSVATASLMLDTREAEREERRIRVPLGIVMAMAGERLISVDELRSVLRERGFPESDIALIVAAAMYEPVVPLSQSMIERAYRTGILERHQAVARLIHLGFTPSDAEKIIATLEAEIVIPIPKPSLGLLLEAARSNVITLIDLANELRERGYTDTDVKMIQDIVEERRIIPLTTDAVLDAFQVGVLGREAAQSKLVELGMSVATATLMLDTREAERVITPPRVPLGVIMALANEGLITPDELVAILRDRKFPESDIPLIVAAALYETPTPLSQGIVERAYKEGVLSRDEAIDRLFVLGYSVPDANKIIQTVESEMTITQPRASVGAYVAATRDGIISPGELRMKLERIGFSVDDVEMFVSLAMFQPAMPAKKLTKTETLNAYEAFMYNRVDALRRLEMLGYAIEDADLLIRMKRRDPVDSEVHMLYRDKIIDLETALLSLFAIGYTEQQIDEYFEHWLLPE